MKRDGRTRVDSCKNPVSDGRGLDALAAARSTYNQKKQQARAIETVDRYNMFMYHYHITNRVQLWRRQKSGLSLGVGVVVAERSEALTNQT